MFWLCMCVYMHTYACMSWYMCIFTVVSFRIRTIRFYSIGAGYNKYLLPSDIASPVLLSIVWRLKSEYPSKPKNPARKINK